MDAARRRHRGLGSIRATVYLTTSFSLLVSFAPAAHAAAIGAVPQPEGLRWGALFGMTRADIDDPAGPTDTKNYSRLALIGTLPAAKHRRWLGEVFYHRFDLEAGTESIGVDVTRLGAALSYQARFAGLPLKPWFGAGVNVSRDRFEERLTVDTAGFVANRYADRSDTALGMVLTATTAWKWTPSTDMGLQLQYEQPLTGDVKALTLGVLLIF